MTSTTLPEIFHGLPQSRQARVDTLRQLGHDHFLLNSFTFITCRPSLIDLHLQTDLTNCLSQAVSHKPCLTNSLTGRLSQTMSHKHHLRATTVTHNPSHHWTLTSVHSTVGRKQPRKINEVNKKPLCNLLGFLTCFSDSESPSAHVHELQKLVCASLSGR